MNFYDYRELAKRTNADLGSPEADRWHMVLGLATELGELADVFKKDMAYNKPIDWVNVSEEIGDFMWYYANLSDMLEYRPPKITSGRTLFDTIMDGIIFLISQVGAVALSIRTGDALIRANMGDVWLAINRICYLADLDIGKIFEANIDKLEKRYPDLRFNEQHAVNRDLDKERRTLEVDLYG